MKAKSLCALGLLGLLPLAVPQPLRANRQADTGQSAYMRVCASCHGTDAKGQNGPALVPFERDILEVRGIVRDGRGEMPSISPDDVSDDELTRIVAYLKNLSAPQR